MTAFDPEQMKPGPIIAGLIGTVFGKYVGAAILVPAVGTVVAVIALNKKLPDARPEFKFGLALLIGHAVWMAVGAFLLQSVAAVWMDLLAYAILIPLLLRNPDRKPAVALMAIQTLAIALNVKMILGVPPGSPAFKAILLHLVLRTVGTGLIVFGIEANRRRAVTAQAG